MKLANVVGPFLVAERNKELAGFAATVAAAVPETITVPAEKADFMTRLTAERHLWNATRFQPYVLSVFQTALAAKEATGETEVILEEHPPEIPHIRTFVKQEPPVAPKPPEVLDKKMGEQGSGGNSEAGGTRLILD